MESVGGHDLASDEQCVDGEDQSLKYSPSRDLQVADDDVWVVPYDDGMQIGQSNHLRTQFEDTKL